MMLKKTGLFLYNSILSTRAAGLYLLIFAAAIGGATFIENDYGTSSAQETVFRARWFEVLLILFGCTILANIYRFRMIKQKKWASLIFHSSIIIIILGAGVTRYFGYEGMMHIREGSSSDKFLSSEQHLKFSVLYEGKTYSFDENTHFATLGANRFNESYQIGPHLYQIKLKEFIPNPIEKISPDSKGLPVMKVVIAGSQGREEYFVNQGDRTNINGVNFNFTNDILPSAFNVRYVNDSLLFSTDVPVSQMVMATQTKDSIFPGDFHELKLRSMYTVGNSGFVIGDFRENGKVEIISDNPKMKNESIAGLLLEVNRNGESKEVMITGRKGDEGQPKILDFGDTKISLTYGAKYIHLPFSLKCNDFIMERYPGTDNPSSYASEVTLLDTQNGVNNNFRIYMNNILDYGGYRFFQSSFDQDELGTYLSVNNDFWGTWISYIGYILLTIGLIMVFFSKNSRFSALTQKLGKYHQRTLQSAIFICVGFIGLFPVNSFGQNSNPPIEISLQHANNFGELLVQDVRGRFKPVNTLTAEVLRKVSKQEALYGMTSDQIFLSMMKSPMTWEQVPIINAGSHPEIQKLLNSTEKLVSYADFFGADGKYLLRDIIRNAQSVNPKDQGTFEKTVIKLDEKVNIVSMVFSGRLLKIFPVPNDLANTWISPADLNEMKSATAQFQEYQMMFSQYVLSLAKAQNDNNWAKPDSFLSDISNQQWKNNSEVLPSKSKISAELLLNKLDVFSKLRNVYGLMSILLLGVFFYAIFKPKFPIVKATKILWMIMVAAFIFHTIGLGLRWYVSGRAPWSNGYESMIYIGWTTMLAGLLFSRRSLGGLAATAVLAATILLVASMSWLDPEITPLVPVLKSYWLTIHVSLEAGSYGFLMLGAVIGMLNLILFSIVNNKNKHNILRATKELTMISEITLLGGLAMVSIGTYLGGVWANESWGRYWGWDAKETWALVTILVYAFILHMRFIPGLQSIFAFNFASLFGFATVVMTYFGVNYYLSGLHSYAAGDPVPIPTEVYYTVIALVFLSIIAYINYRRKYLKD